MPDKPPSLSTFEAVAQMPSASFRALRVLFSHIGGIADEYDEGAWSAFLTSFKELCPSGDQTLGEKDKAAELDNGISPEPSTDPPSTWTITLDAEKKAKLCQIIDAVARKTPMQGHLIRQGALTMLFSHFEGALAALLHLYYERYPAALPADKQTLTLTDLRQVGSVSEAEKLIVGKEVDSVLRQGTEEQIAYFRNRLKIKVEPLIGLMSSLVEVAQRRNIYVHNYGKVNRQYLASVDQALATQYQAETGKKLQLSTDYLLSSIDTVDAVAAMLIQTCWRKWDKPKDADSNLLSHIYEALQEQRYEYVKVLAVFAKGADMVEDVSRRIVVINHAIALRETGDQEGVNRIIQETDWSAASLRFSLALHVLRKEQDGFLKLLPRVVAAEQITVEELQEWPLFKPWRGQGWFDSTLAGIKPTP